MESIFDLARARDPDRAFAVAFAPPSAREALSALICLDHELARARAAVREPMAALIRLQWWRDAIAEAAAGQSPRRHEVAGPLARMIADGRFDASALIAMVDARDAEAEGDVPTRSAFRAWARGTAGAVAVATARLLGVAPELLPAVERAGEVFGVARALRSLPEQARQGRCRSTPSGKASPPMGRHLACRPEQAQTQAARPPGSCWQPGDCVATSQDPRRTG